MSALLQTGLLSGVDCSKHAAQVGDIVPVPNQYYCEKGTQGEIILY